MTERDIRYCASADSTTIGYVYYGAGRPPPIVSVAHSLVPMESRTFDSGMVMTIQKMAKSRPVLTFDRRGIGYSQRDAADVNDRRQLSDFAAVLCTLASSSSTSSEWAIATWLSRTSSRWWSEQLRSAWP